MDFVPDEILQEIFSHVQIKRSSSLCRIRSVNRRFLRIVNNHHLHRMDTKEFNKEIYSSVKNLALKGDTFSLFMNGIHSVLFHKLLIWSCTFGNFDLFYHSFSYVKILGKNYALKHNDLYYKRNSKIGQITFDLTQYRQLIKKCIRRAILGMNLKILCKLSSMVHLIKDNNPHVYMSINDEYGMCERYHYIKHNMDDKNKKAIQKWLIDILGISPLLFKDCIIQAQAYCRHGDIPQASLKLREHGRYLHVTEYQRLLRSSCSGGDVNMLDWLLQNGKEICMPISSFQEAIELLNEVPWSYLLPACKSRSSSIIAYLLKNMYGERLKRDVNDILTVLNIPDSEIRVMMIDFLSST